ncbi:hypothetical protein V5799_033972 [Amblyomma americanum]|uniref:Uncharacterized protein n=1 Tax=Amblyomma americanum TaxID=6943 RepID=A0AAQ4DLS8_AMBAM
MQALDHRSAQLHTTPFPGWAPMRRSRALSSPGGASVRCACKLRHLVLQQSCETLASRLARMPAPCALANKGHGYRSPKPGTAALLTDRC